MIRIVEKKNPILGEYDNGNYHVTIYEDGTKVRETFDENATEFVAEYPECMDVKITNRCGKGCSWCHENSTPDGEHGEILTANFWDTLKPYTEIACLAGDTVVYTDEGSKMISELKLGDKIFDSEHILREVIQISKSNKSVIGIKGYKGFNVRCSKDHPFIVENSLMNAEDLMGYSIDRIKEISEKENEEYYINLDKYIHTNNPNLMGSRGGRIIDENYVRLRNSTKKVPRQIKVDEDLMWLYGLFVAEGSRKGFSLNIDETEYVERIRKIWYEKLGNNIRVYENKEGHSIAVELQSASLVDDIFVKEFSVGKGAHNKNLSYLYKLENKKLIRSAICGLFDGDGSYRKRKYDSKNGVVFNYVASYKTASRQLAYDILYLLAKHFGVYASISEGWNPIRKLGERTLPKSKYYMVEIYNQNDIDKIFFDRFEKRERLQNQGSKFNFKVKEIIENIEQEVLYDITLSGGTHIFPINGYYLTHNCGGGDPLSHPDLVTFLIKLKNLKLIPNMTVNQTHFMQNWALLKFLCEEKLIYGLGVSLVEPTEDFIEKIKEFPNAVIHIINGVVKKEQLAKLANNDLKVLILGYKEFRRGITYLEEHLVQVEMNKMALYDYLPDMLNEFKVVSFDNLALEQLEVKRLLTEEEWNEFYMGNDGKYTMYIDLVKKQFALCSVAEERFDLLDDIKPMFDKVKSLNV